MQRDWPEFLRYLLNGVACTLIHYFALVFFMEVVDMVSAGAANVFAASIGIVASFFGSRYFVFRGHTGTARSQFVCFVILYGIVAMTHGIVLFLWTDVGGFDYRSGFLIALAIQISSTYIGNRYWVFSV